MIAPGEKCCDKVTYKCENCFSYLEANPIIGKICNKLLKSKTFSYRFPIKSHFYIDDWYSKNKELLENAKCILPVSTRVKEIFENSGIKGNYLVTHIGNISADEFDKIKDMNKKDNNINVVYLSQFSEIKGGNLFCKILERVNNPNLKIHFYGRLTSKYQENLLKIHGIINHGSYKQTDLKSILAKMDMGVVMPIWEDNAPQVVMEMLNNRIPILCTKMGGIPDFVNFDNGFLFNPFSEEEIEGAINFLETLTIDKINNLKKNIRRTKTPLEHYLEMEKIYNEIIKKNI